MTWEEMRAVMDDYVGSIQYQAPDGASLDDFVDESEEYDEDEDD